ncbi:MAG TPA: PQQ-binding-like beta-propeller repeat protein [Candidatus Baltobacteraceae bacterium]|nr:PQQ-binding-like beta-propeller repeat protein [Candidatus Baltobacteraceae bacterium]
MYQYSSSHNAVFTKPDVRAKWIAQLDGRVNGGLAVVGNTIYVTSFDQHLYAIDLNSGHIRWKASTGNIVMSTPVVADGIVVVGSGHDGFLASDPTAQIWGRKSGDNVMAFDTKTGRMLWTFHTKGEDMASPAIDGTRLVFANGDLHAYGLDLRSGRPLWMRRLLGIDTMASTTIRSGVAYIGLCHNMPHFRRTLAVRTRSGHLVWSNPNGSCDASPAVDNGIVFVDGNDERLNTPYATGGADIVAAIDEATGKTLWHHASSPGPYTLVASGEHAIAGTATSGVLYQSIVNRNAVVAFDGRTGRELWRVQTSGPVKMSPIVTQGRVVFGDTAGVLYSVYRVNGDVLHTRSFKSPFSTSPPVIVGGTLLIANGHSLLAMPWDDP